MEDMDFEAIAKQLTEENERLRLLLFKTHVSRAPSLAHLLEQANVFVRENYLLIMVALFVGSSVIGGLYTVWRDSRE